MPILFTFTGRVPSKKNSKRILRAGNRSFIASSKDYSSWEKRHVQELRAAGLVRRPIASCEVTVTFYAGDRRKFDLTNKAEGIMDVMVLAGLLEDDNFQVVRKVTLVYGGYRKGEWLADVSVETDD